MISCASLLGVPESGKFRKGDDSCYGEKVKGRRKRDFSEEKEERKTIRSVVNIMTAAFVKQCDSTEFRG
jgi:hypothetical protein